MDEGFCFEGVEGGRVEAEDFGEDLARMLAEERCRATGSDRGLHGRPGDLMGASCGMVQRGEHAAEMTLGMGGHFLKVQDQGAGDAIGLQ